MFPLLVLLIRLMAGLGPTAFWTVVFFAGVVTVFVGYIGIALWAVLHARPEQQQVRYEVFRDLLDLFRRGRSK